MKQLMKPLQVTCLAALLMGSLPLLSGCGGGGGNNYHAPSNKTLGEELQDLQQSYDKGIITKKEYESTKKKLMKKYTE
jgi:hypothetical protein